MSTEQPIAKKCCGIIPNCTCLVIFASLKLTADFIGAALSGYVFLILLAFYGDTEISSLIFLIGLILDIIFMIILIIGACKKTNFHLKLSYYYSIISLIVAVTSTVVCLLLAYTQEDHFIGTEFYSFDVSEWGNTLIHIAVMCAYTLIHICMIMVMKREISNTASNKNIYHTLKIHKESTHAV